MNEIGFKKWLVDIDGRDVAQTRDNLSRCKRVEDSLSQYYNTEISLDIEYDKDILLSVIDFLNLNNSHIDFESISLPRSKAGLSSLKTAVRKYRNFKHSKR